MPKPLVAIVGRPNVGKSTFFNKIAGRRISIVEDTPGVTRDRIYADTEWMGRRFTLIDTGGLDLHSDDVLLTEMRHQAQIAMDTADVICLFCDGRVGPDRRGRGGCRAASQNPQADFARGQQDRQRKPKPTPCTIITALAWATRSRYPPPICWGWATCWRKIVRRLPPPDPGRAGRVAAT